MCVRVCVLLALLGVVTYGTHINGYSYNDSGEMLMWIAKRAKGKGTYPGMYDNLVRTEYEECGGVHRRSVTVRRRLCTDDE